MPEPISALCRDPVHTRAAAVAGEQVPCYRCLAYRESSASGCFFIDTGQRPARRKRQPKSPTPDKLWEP